MSVLETVQETLFKQFLGGSDPNRRLGVGQEGSHGHSRVEDLPWWRYNRSLALWYCEWLDTYYDSVDGAFFWRDELTQAFEDANLAEIREAAERMRLELPREGPDRGEPEEEDLGEEAPETSEANAGAAQRSSAAKAESGPGSDGDWHVAVLANMSEEEELWKDAGQGNFTHWAAEVGRMFLWQERTGVLYEYHAGKSTSSTTSPPRYEALWAAQGPLAVLSRCDDPQSARLVDHRGLDLGHADDDGKANDSEDSPFWELVGPGIQRRHARLSHGESGWRMEAFSGAEILVDGQRAVVAEQSSLLLKHGSLLRIGTLTELRIDLPETPDSARPGPTPSSSTRQSPAVLEKTFVPRQDEEEEFRGPLLSGSERARELNRALRRIICGPAAAASVGEKNDAMRREALYEDRAEKRRRLHPVEWSQVPYVAKQETSSATRSTTPQLLDEGSHKVQPQRRFREASAT